jgi:hypothetical protein
VYINLRIIVLIRLSRNRPNIHVQIVDKQKRLLVKQALLFYDMQVDYQPGANVKPKIGFLTSVRLNGIA